MGGINLKSMLGHLFSNVHKIRILEIHFFELPQLCIITLQHVLFLILI